MTYSSDGHVNLKTHAGGESLMPGEIVTISWEEEQTHVPVDCDLQFSSDGGVTWEDIASLNVDQFEYQWVVPNIETEQGRIKVIQDNEGTNYTDVSSNFRISVSPGIVTAVGDTHDNSGLTKILSHYPNPFQAGTVIEFSLTQYQHVALHIYNLQGSIQTTLINEVLPAGKHLATWAPSGAKPGVYLVLFQVGAYFETRKLLKSD